jgi:hypothetical protein
VKGNDSINTEKTKRKEGSGLNRDVVVFAFFLFLSFVFWYLNSLGKDTEDDIKYALEYVNIPQERVIVAEPPGKLTLYLKGPGYAIMKLKLSGNSSPFKIDLSKVNYKRIPGNGFNNYFILTSTLTKSLNVQLRSECEILSIRPDTLFFTLEKLILKSASLRPDNVSIKKGIK